MPDSSSFAIIGAGPSGLAVARALKAKQIPYVQFEADDDLGGNWYHGVYETVHIISSKKTTEFADYPMPDSYPDFPSGDQMLEYLRNYAEHFGLRDSIQFNTNVKSVTPRGDDSWNVQIEITDEEGTKYGEERTFKGVIVCNGHHWDKRYPNYPGKFDGDTLHSKDYKKPDQLRDKRVLVVGGGNSGCDIASEAARVGSFCGLSLRRGYWFLPKTVFGIPITELPSVSWPVSMQRLVLRAILKVVTGDYRKFGLPLPDHKIFERHPSANSELLHYLRHGRITCFPDIKQLDGKYVEFVDGRKVEFDSIVYATGYHLSFPFLSKDILQIKNGVVQLYGGSAPADWKNLYVFGTLQPRYGFGPLMTPAATLLASLIELQDEMVMPVGLVLKKIGDKPQESPLVDPIYALRKLNGFQKRCRLLLPVEKRMRKSFQVTVEARHASP